MIDFTKKSNQRESSDKTGSHSFIGAVAMSLSTSKYSYVKLSSPYPPAVAVIIRLTKVEKTSSVGLKWLANATAASLIKRLMAHILIFLR
ncbi:hypothetical protein P4S73_30275 [Paraglaciecola sp. Hal342]|jgi:hypothetical protein|uniref:Uncharacterized protein n=1 Tax=Paraglaciecola chathamensis TaxID=368405 RepID=A0A8H9IKA9_9ALTE|nr:hypothetical protein [Paraglaciecola oceanifecundans]GGZ79952.1 hypothetical protein GCM10011274_42350 [Paraglaciecola oceanifecundans]|tara:strand:- start:4548 stop:4817 length:270 start_codon:yes stop_codon:yes gene_type:complete